MQFLTRKLLTKNDKERPLLKDLLADPFIRKTMKEFVESKGQDVKSEERIPIKKTLTHQEFKKILDEDVRNQEEEENRNETPYQRMVRRKIEKTQKQEEEMKIAARQAYVGKMDHKQRKYEDLFGSSPTVKKNENINNNSQLNLGKSMQPAGKSFLANKAINQNEQIKNNCELSSKYDKVKIELSFFVIFFCKSGAGSTNFQTCQSLEYSESTGGFKTNFLQENNNNNNKNNNNSNNNNNNSTNNNQLINCNNNNNYNITNNNNNNVTKYMTISTEYTQNFNKFNENTNTFNSFNNLGEKTANYEDDFEEYNSEEDNEQGDHDKTRLTNKASMKEIEDVVDIYKNELNENKTAKKDGFYNNNILEGIIFLCFVFKVFFFCQKFKEIKETTIENSLADSSLKKTNPEIMTKDQRIMILKDRYSVLLGPDIFKKVVIFISNCFIKN